MFSYCPTSPGDMRDDYPSRIQATPQRLPRRDPVVWGHAAAGPLDDVALADYAARGFLLRHALFENAEIAGLRVLAERLRHAYADHHDERIVREPGNGAVRSIFEVHALSEPLLQVLSDPRILGIARQLLGSEVYLHQTRVNYKPGFRGREFYWHSDFETWHVEDGMPRMRALSCSISLTPNTEHNGPLLLIPGSHRHFISCVGTTPENHYQQSLQSQQLGVPDDAELTALVEAGGIESFTGPAGSVLFFECNTMHGSNSNISPLPRSNIFAVYNSIENRLQQPYCGLPPRPQFLAERSNCRALRAGIGRLRDGFVVA